jgi:2-deoxy-D-gluconate 3-dehydrogenase
LTLAAFSLAGKVALVTGAARGLGRAIACGLAEAGADLLLVDRLPVDDTRAEISRLGRRGEARALDLQSLTSDGAHSVVEQCVTSMGRLDVLVNNAGIMRRTPALELSLQDWEAVLNINLSAAFLLSQAAARHFVAVGTGGKIINIASMLSFQGGQLVSAYTAAKSGIAGLTRSLASEWAAYGINVNAIAPGYMTTEITRELREDPQRHNLMLARIPAGRWGLPDDLKGAAVFLASDASRYVHGAILPVDGGWLAR